jgi:hypothetical protein
MRAVYECIFTYVFVYILMGGTNDIIVNSNVLILYYPCTKSNILLNMSL